jgi:hypothetical protein
MPNEIRPRRETSSTSRIRKTAAPSAAAAGDEPVGAGPSFTKAGEPVAGAPDKPRERIASRTGKKGRPIASRSDSSASASVNRFANRSPSESRA